MPKENGIYNEKDTKIGKVLIGRKARRRTISPRGTNGTHLAEKSMTKTTKQLKKMNEKVLQQIHNK